MKTLAIILVALVWTPEPDEKAAITKTLNYYLEGGTNRDFDTLKRAFHEDAIMTRITDEGLVQVNARDFFSKMKAGDPLKRSNEIVSIDIGGNTAVARLKIEDNEKIFHDFMTLQKINDSWYIVNKSFFLERK